MEDDGRAIRRVGADAPTSWVLSLLPNSEAAEQRIAKQRGLAAVASGTSMTLSDTGRYVMSTVAYMFATTVYVSLLPIWPQDTIFLSTCAAGCILWFVLAQGLIGALQKHPNLRWLGIWLHGFAFVSNCILYLFINYGLHLWQTTILPLATITVPQQAVFVTSFIVLLMYLAQAFRDITDTDMASHRARKLMLRMLEWQRQHARRSASSAGVRHDASPVVLLGDGTNDTTSKNE